MKEESKKYNKKQIFIYIVLFAIGLALGDIVSGLLLGNFNKSNSDNTEQKEEKKEEQKEEVNVSELDIVSVNLMSGEIYYISNGDLYFYKLKELESARYFIITHSGCLSDNSSDYCKLNSPYYDQKPVKVEGVSNVVKIKLFNGYKSGGESFQTYAITESGDAYEINEGKVGLLAFTNVIDMYGNKNNEVVVSYKDGTTKVSEYTYSNDV